MRLRPVGAAVGIVAVASAAFFAVACSSASGPGGTTYDGKPSPTATVAPPGIGGDSDSDGAASASERTDATETAGCAPARGSYAVTYTETASAGTGCELDGGSRTATEAFPAGAGAGDGGLPDGCDCSDSLLRCTFTSTLRGVSTATTTLSETFTATGWTGTVSFRVSDLDGGVVYLCTQSVSATKNAP